MEESKAPTLNRFGLHYYPDTLHYTDKDLEQWLPALESLRVGWLVLLSQTNRAVPERFISALLRKGITPVIQFTTRLATPPNPADLQPILQAYANWGVRHVLFYQRPNVRKSWPESGWAQADLVERFIDRWLPLASLAAQAGLTPVFPILEPGGDYWDTAFLRAALVSLERRGQTVVLEKLVLSACGATHGHPLNWGEGGPERWPSARPYFTAAEEQDQRGFCIFDWYQAVARAVLQRDLPILMLETGLETTLAADARPCDAQTSTAIVRLLNGGMPVEGAPAELPASLLCGAFWLLTTAADSPHSRHAWFQPDGSRLPVVEAIQQAATQAPQAHSAAVHSTAHNISHYLLLPSYEWGISDWHLELVRPFIKKYRPTVGFSVEEAAQAEHITVIGGTDVFPDELLASLRGSGCEVERIEGDGTTIASTLAER